MNKITSVVFLMILFGCQPNDKNPDVSFLQLNRFIDQYTQSTLKHGAVNAMSVAIYKDGNTYHNYYGEIDLGSKNPPNDNSLFEIASISKVFVGSIMAKAVIDKKVSLDSDIRNFLPGAYPNLEYNNTAVTIRNLLTHTLGFKTPKGLKSVYEKIVAGYYANNAIDYNMSNLLVELKSVALDHTPGSYYEYNNVGPDLAAYILEKLYKKSYPNILREFLDEIGMKNTYLQEYARHKEYLITGYTESGTPATIDKNPLLGGASGIITTLPDLTKFMRYQLESNKKYIKESRRSLYQNEEENIGYLWDLGFAKEEGFYYLKSGTSNGVQSIMLLCPDSDYGQILLMNNTSEKATNDWIGLYNKIEYDLIKYPKLNLWSTLEPLFYKDPKEASSQYMRLKKDTLKYFSESSYLNKVGFDFLYHNQPKKSIAVFKLAILTDPENANLYDSLGEIYFKEDEYEKSKEQYEKSLKLNPKNSNAKKYLANINQLLIKTQ
jgi:CubicO group peptidase (beta-lactamase class C family)